jgi:hypothetical protein
MVAYLVFLATDNGFDYVNQFGIFVFAYIGMSEKARELLVTEPLQGQVVFGSDEAKTGGPKLDTQKPLRYPILQK